MVHIPNTYTHDFWQQTSEQVVELSCFMPNGVFIAIKVNKNATLHEIKLVSF